MKESIMHNHENQVESESMVAQSEAAPNHENDVESEITNTEALEIDN